MLNKKLKQSKRKLRNKNVFIDSYSLNFVKTQKVGRARFCSAIIKNSAYKKVADIVSQEEFLKTY